MSGDVSALNDAEFELERALAALDCAEGALATPSQAAAEVARLSRPCIRLFTERLMVNRGDVMRPDYHEIEAPVIELSFEYPGFTVSSSSHMQRVFATNGPRGAQPKTFTRDVEAETRARATLLPVEVRAGEGREDVRRVYQHGPRDDHWHQRHQAPYVEREHRVARRYRAYEPD